MYEEDEQLLGLVVFFWKKSILENLSSIQFRLFLISFQRIIYCLYPDIHKRISNLRKVLSGYYVSINSSTFNIPNAINFKQPEMTASAKKQDRGSFFFYFIKV